MTILTLSFLILGLGVLAATALAMTRANLVHTVLLLVASFFGTAGIFYILGAPLLAALEVIVYAGAIMIVFLFIIMMLPTTHALEKPPPVRALLALGTTAAFLGIMLRLSVLGAPDDRAMLTAAWAPPSVFGKYLFTEHWFSIEVASLLLLIALVAALVLGKNPLAEKSVIAQDQDDVD